MEELDPISRIEFFLDAVLNGDPAPFEPFARAEFYLAYLCGSAVTLPTPQSRVDFYLAYKCGEDVEIPDPIERIDFYLAKWCGMDVEIPDPIHPIEYWLAQLANSGELKTVTGNPISVSDALARPAESLTIEILPKQDLHGYANPWPAGGGKNLFDASSVSDDNTYINITNGTETSPSSGAWRHSDYIKVTPGTVLYFGKVIQNASVAGSAFYDENKDFISGSGVSETDLQTAGKVWTVPAGASYMRTSFSIGSAYNPNWETTVYVVLNSDTHEWSPYSNICPISGFTGVNIYHESAYDPDADPTYSIDWTDEAGTVYGGSLDVTTGVLTTAPYYNSYNGEPLVGPWVSSMDKYISGNTPTTGAQVVDLGGTGTEVQLTPTQVDMLLGNNVLWNDINGDMTLEYLADGPADDIDALQILLNNRYVNNGEPDEATDKEALEILLGGNTR